jgi:uncharacterized Zn finger protein (UPF0148 family)
MTAPEAIERVVRVCPQHKVVLRERRDGELVCPKCRHAVARWQVVDRERSLIVGEADARNEEMEEMRQKVREVKGEPVAEREVNVKTLASKRFDDGRSRVLFVSLIHKAKQGAFVVAWKMNQKVGSKESTTSGGRYFDGGAVAEAAARPYELRLKSARKAWDEAIREAQAQGWQEVESYALRGGREMRMAAIPPAAPRRDIEAA